MIVVAGATGTLGPLLVPLLVAGGEPVRVVTRDPERGRRFEGVEVVGADVCTPEGAREAVAGARVVISAITGFASPAGVRAVDERGNRMLANAAADAGVERFILVSVAQAAPDHPIELFRAKAAAEAAVRSSGIAWTIVRPTAYLETWLGIVGGPMVASGKALIFGRGRNPINFVSAVDVARTIEHAVAAPIEARQTIEVPGPAEPDAARSRRHRPGRDRTFRLQPADPARDAPPVVGGATARQQDASPADRRSAGHGHPGDGHRRAADPRRWTHRSR